MKGFAKKGVLPARPRHHRTQFGEDEGPDEGDCPAHRPGQQNQKRGLRDLRDEVRIDENTGADDPADHNDRGIEEGQLARKDRMRRSLAQWLLPPELELVLDTDLLEPGPRSYTPASVPNPILTPLESASLKLVAWWASAA